MHPNLLSRDDAVLVVVDVQGPFVRAVFETDRVVSNVIKLVESAKVLGLPVLVTLQNKARMGDTIPEIAAALPEHEPIDKMTFSCCGVEPFPTALKALGRTTVVLCGVETHVCVNQTAHDLIELGFAVQVPGDAVSSRTEGNWRAGIERMRDIGVIITSTEMAIFELLRSAAAPEFKRILELVK